MEYRYQSSPSATGIHPLHDLAPAYHSSPFVQTEAPFGYQPYSSPADANVPTRPPRAATQSHFASQVPPTVHGQSTHEFDDLRRAVEASRPHVEDEARQTDTQSGGLSAGTSFTYKVVSFLGSTMAPYFMSTLLRPADDCREDMIHKMNELGVHWTERQDRDFDCEYGMKGTPDHIVFEVIFFQNGSRLPTASWRTQVYVQWRKGYWQKFRQIGRQVFEAAKYTRHGDTVYVYVADDALFSRDPREVCKCCDCCCIT